jgi:hypothetical protein
VVRQPIELGSDNRYLVGGDFFVSVTVSVRSLMRWSRPIQRRCGRQSSTNFEKVLLAILIFKQTSFVDGGTANLAELYSLAFSYAIIQVAAKKITSNRSLGQ